MSLILLVITILVSLGLAAYIATGPDVPHWLKMLLNVALGLIVVIGIVMAVFVIVAIAAHI